MAPRQVTRTRHPARKAAARVKAKREPRAPLSEELARQGLAIRRLREAKNWTQEGVADLVRKRLSDETITDGWVSDIELGRIDTAIGKFAVLAEVLDAEIHVAPKSDRRQRVIEALHADAAALGPVLRTLISGYEGSRPPDEPAVPRQARTA